MQGASVANACFGMQLFNDSLRAQDKYNGLHSKYVTVKKEVNSMRNVFQRNQNLENDVIPKRDKIISDQKKDIDKYVAKILVLRKECDASMTVEAEAQKATQDLKVQLDSEIRSSVSLNYTIEELRASLSQSEKKLKDQLSQSAEELSKVKEDLRASSELVEDLKFENNFKTLTTLVPPCSQACLPTTSLIYWHGSRRILRRCLSIRISLMSSRKKRKRIRHA